MVVRDDGTKWACQSCLKGHRVSGCTHVDRELKLVPKKGRPVTQCQHCRQERKKRSAHVKCDCAEPDKPHHTKEKCIHLREAEQLAKNAGFFDGGHHEQDPGHLAAVAEEQGCCCHHGGKCSCASMKKESCHDDDDDATPPHGKPAVQKPRLDSTKSDGSITVFANGHHKPVHRKNHAAHDCGMPYKLPMSRSKTEQDLGLVIRRSVDNMAPFDPSLTGSPIDDDHQVNRNPFHGTRRLSKSEHTSPRMTALPGVPAENYNLVDFPDLNQARTNETVQSTGSGSVAFPAFDPMSSVSDSAFESWAAFSSASPSAIPDYNSFGVWPTNTDVSGLAQPALTAASSGTQSEIDEIPMIMEDVYVHGLPTIQQEGSADFEAQAEPVTSSSPQSNRRSLPPNFFANNDIALPNPGDDWQVQFGGLDERLDAKLKSNNGSMNPYDYNNWQLSSNAQVSAMDFSRRSVPSGPLSPSRRPVAHSVGSGSAPSSDIMKQLFPEMDWESGNNATPSAMSLNPARDPRSQSLSTGIANNQTFADHEQMRVSSDGRNNTFSHQSWDDGSLSVPSDAFNPNFDFNQTYPNPDFTTPNWTQ